MGDEVVENAGEGGDIVYATIDYTIGDNIESLVLVEGAGSINAVGNNENNALIGNSENNTLDGKGGSDFMVGGDGDDRYFVDVASDAVVENAGEGSDRVDASVSYTLSANVEALVLLESGGAISAAGNNLNNALIGNSFANTLDGKGGSDFMVGGAGNDTYIVDVAGDQVVENAGEGTTDTVQTLVSYGLAANVENLVLLESGGAINGTGNSAANTITGNSFANVINGAGGADTLIGDGGNDTFLIPDSDFAQHRRRRRPRPDHAQYVRPELRSSPPMSRRSPNIEIISLAASSGATLSLSNPIFRRSMRRRIRSMCSAAPTTREHRQRHGP